MSDRAALVDQLATAIVDIEAELNDGNPAPLAERIVAWFEAAGWGPPVVTPEPDVLPPEVEAALNASLREHRAIYQQLADTPEPDAEVRDVLAEAIRITPHGALGDGPNAYDRTADAGLAALRDKGFAVVRTADVGGLCPPSVIAWFVKHGYDFESMRESLRAFPDDSEYMDELSDALVAAEHWVADDEVYARVKEAIR